MFVYKKKNINFHFQLLFLDRDLFRIIIFFMFSLVLAFFINNIYSGTKVFIMSKMGTLVSDLSKMIFIRKAFRGFKICNKNKCQREFFSEISF